MGVCPTPLCCAPGLAREVAVVRLTHGFPPPALFERWRGGVYRDFQAHSAGRGQSGNCS